MADVSPPDLTLSGFDLSGSHDLFGADLSGTDQGSHSGTCRGGDAPGALLKEATNNILLPAASGSRTYAMDLDGDGRTENQLKTVTQVLSIAGIDLQASINDDVLSGTLVYLLGLTTLKLDNSTCTGVSLFEAKPRGSGDPAPKYDGTDVFVKNPGAQADLAATITSNALSSKASKDLSIAEEAKIDLTFNLNGTPLVLPVHGLHVQGTLASNGGKLFIQTGQLNGAIAQDDIQNKVLPAVAQLVTSLINGDPTGSTGATLIGLFENMSNAVTKTKCMVAADCCHTSPTTCKIIPEEIQASPIGGVMAPDVQVFNELGQWVPAPLGSMKNGMSIGIGFTAVPATY
jgi:hypothetical protein